MQLVRILGEFTSKTINHTYRKEKDFTDKQRNIQRIIKNQEFFPVFQPICEISSQKIVGYEALSRFTAKPSQGPDRWFFAAEAVQLRHNLEIATLHAALWESSTIPDHCYLSVNVSADTIATDEFRNVIEKFTKERLVIELTEHDSVTSYSDLNETLNLYRKQNIQIAADDVGAGYSSFRHILWIKPNTIKIDMSIVQGVDSNPEKRALIMAFANYAKEANAKIIAEGIETEGELATLQEMEVGLGQGYFLGKPAVLPQ